MGTRNGWIGLIQRGGATDGAVSKTQASHASKRGIAVTIESVGLARVRGIKITFDGDKRSRIRSVSIEEAAYAGSAATALAWLLNFALRKARGKHLRDGLPPVSARGFGNGMFGNGRALAEFADVTPRAGSPGSQSEEGTPRSARRFVRFGVGSLRMAFVFSGIEIVTRRASGEKKMSEMPEKYPSASKEKPKSSGGGMTRNKWRLIKGIASFVDVTVVSFTVREEDDSSVDTFFCDKMTFESSGSTSARLKSLITARVLRGKDGWSLTDANVHVAAEFDAESKAIVPVHAGLSGATLSLVKRRGGGVNNSRDSVVEKPSTSTKGPHKAVQGLLKMPRKCAVEFKRVLIEDRDENAPISFVLNKVQGSVERLSESGRGFRLFRKRDTTQSPFALTSFGSDPWAEFTFSAEDAKFIHDKHKKLAICTGMSASVALALSEKLLDDEEKLPATAAFEIDKCELRHHADLADLIVALKSRSKSKKKEGETKPPSKRQSDIPWDVIDAHASCVKSFSVHAFDEEGSATCVLSTKQIIGRYGKLVEDAQNELVVDINVSCKRGVCTLSRAQFGVPGFHPVVQFESARFSSSESEGSAVELEGSTLDVDMDEAAALILKIERAASSMKAAVSAAKAPKSDDKEHTTRSPSAKMMRLSMVDTAVRAKCSMTPYSTFGEIPQNSRGNKAVICALELMCPLAEITRQETDIDVVAGGFTISMFDTISGKALSPGQSLDGENEDDTWLSRIDYESTAVESNRVMLFGNFDVKYKTGEEKRANVAVDGVEFDWEPDVHFLALKLAHLAKSAKPSPKTPSDVNRASTEVKKKFDVTIDVRSVSGSFFITPGACAQISFTALEANSLKKSCCVREGTFGLNGHDITTINLVIFELDCEGRSRPHVQAIVHEEEEDVRERRKFGVTVEGAKLMLPAGLDLGDAAQAMIAGEQALRDVICEGAKKETKKARVSMTPEEPIFDESSPFQPVNEIDVLVTNIEIDVEDTNRLERFLRARQAVLGGCMASMALKESSEEAIEEVTSLVFHHKDFLRTGGGSALHMTMGGIRSVGVWGGGKGAGDELAQRSAQIVRRVDNPYSNSVALQMQNVFTMNTNMTNVRVCVADLDERPLFACDEAMLAGNFVQARQYAPHILDGQVVIGVGRRRWSKTNGPDTPSRPQPMWFTDADLRLVSAEISMATAIEPYLFNMSRELTTRLVLPRLHKHLPGGGGGRPPTLEYNAADPRPPSMPWWDMLRHTWRGMMRVHLMQTSLKMDAQGRIENLGAHGGEKFRSELEFYADVWELNLRPRHMSLRCSDFSVSRIQDDEDCPLPSNPSSTSEDVAKHHMVVFPVMCVSAAYEFKSKLDGGDGHRTLYRHDSATGHELFSKDLTSSTACFVDLDVTLDSKEDFVKKHVEQSAELDCFVERIREQTSRVSPNEYSQPTFALTPDDVEFASRWKRAMQSPMIALRNIWNFRPWGAPRRVKHPESISLVDLFKSVDTVITSNVIHVVNSSSDETESAFGACFSLHSVNVLAKKAPRANIEFTIRANASQFHVPEGPEDSEVKAMSPMRSFRLANKSISRRLNFAELDDVIKDMLQGSTTSPIMGGTSPHATGARPTSTDPTLVLDTRRVEIIQKAEESVSSEGIQIEVETPRILIEAKQRNSVLGWINELWAAAQNYRREPSWTECERIVEMANRVSLSKVKNRALDTILGEVPTLETLTRAESDAKDSDLGVSPKRAPDTKVLFVISITAPQFNLKGNNAAGRMLLAAEGGLVVGRTVEDGVSDPKRLVTVSLQQVQAYVAPTNVDLSAGVQWLREKTSAGNEVSLIRDDVFGEAERQKSGSLLRRIFAPGTMVFEYRTVITTVSRSITDDALYAYDEVGLEDLHDADDTPDVHEVQAEPVSEFSVRSPEIIAEMNSNQYAVLIDVIEGLFLTPTTVKRPRPSAQAAKLLQSRDRTFLDSMALASSGVVAEPMRSLIAARWAAESVEKNYRRASMLAPSEKQKILGKMDSLWSKAEKSEARVLAAIAEAEELVRLHRRRSAIRLSLDVELAAWTLVAGGHPCIQASLSRLSLSRERQVDSSGTLRFKLHGLGLVSLDQGDREDMFSRWSQGKADFDTPLIDLFSMRAGSAPERPVYDHLELSVLPFQVNIKHSQYKVVHKYFFPSTSTGAYDAFKKAYKRPASDLTDLPESPRESIDERRASNARVGNLLPLQIPVVSPARNPHRREWRWENDAVAQQSKVKHEDVAKQEDNSSKAKVVFLREFRIHPLHMKLTYEGIRRAFRDYEFGIDTFAYNDYRGRWRDLTAELKNHLVWSVLKSLVGIRGKYVEHKIDAKSVFQRTADRIKAKAVMLKRRSSGTESDAGREPTPASVVEETRGLSVSAPGEIERSERKENATQIHPSHTSHAPAKNKPRRFRPYKNTKKFFAAIGVGSYAPGGGASTNGSSSASRHGSRAEVEGAWSAPSKSSQVAE